MDLCGLAVLSGPGKHVCRGVLRTGKGGGIYGSIFYESSGVSGVDLKIRNEASYNCSGRRNCTLAQDAARSQNRFCGGPRPFAKMNGRKHETEVGIGPIVVAGAEIGSLRDADVAFHRDGGEIVDPGALADPAVITYAEVPGVLDFNRRLDDDVLADPRAEESEQMNT